jgi:acyl-CoA thioesterase
MHLFDQDTDSQAPGEGEPRQRRAKITANWSINGLPNGGYLMALMASAMLQHSTKKSMAIITANYMARCSTSDALLSMENISVSSQFERLQARLMQDGKEKIRAWGTFVDENMACALNRCETAPPVMAPLNHCVTIPQMPGFTLFDQLDVRLDPACAGWMTGNRVDRSEQKGWIQFKDARPHDALSLLLMADAFPPPVYATQGLGAWVPTIELSVNIRQLPASEWLKCVFRTRFITCGLIEEDGQLWDETGALIAISRQIAQYRMKPGAG